MCLSERTHSGIDIADKYVRCKNFLLNSVMGQPQTRSA